MARGPSINQINPTDPVDQQFLRTWAEANGVQGKSYSQIKDAIIKRDKEESAAQDKLNRDIEAKERAEALKAKPKSGEKDNSLESTNANASKPSQQANKNTAGRKDTVTEESSYRYPLKQIDATTDFLEIQIKRYVAPDINTESITSQVTSTEKINKEEIIKTIFLPIPQNIQDTNAVGWGEDSLNSIAAYGVGKAEDVIKSQSYIDSILSAFKDVGGEVSRLAGAGGQDLASSFFASKAVNLLGANTSFEGILARSTGQILNPNMELLFNNVKLRSFNFEFDLAPRSVDEGEVIKKIIKELKYQMSPRSSSGGEGSGKGIFLRSPNVFQLVYKQGSGEHPFLHRFKPMALLNMSVNYTGSGTYATYSNATPVHMKLALSFQELNPIYAEDYNGVGGVGY